MSSLYELLEEHSVVVVEATIPADMTIAEWRRVRNSRPPARTARLARLRWRSPLRQGGAR
jgi:hypothetical protein